MRIQTLEINSKRKGGIMNKKTEFSPNMNRRDFLTGTTAFVGTMMLAPSYAFATAPKKPKEIIVRAWGGAWGEALKGGVADGFTAKTGINVRLDFT